ncbi:tetratricopeptide repeat protein [Magnetococcus sp. PR-3]|uniref:tetratricopeptide repeat protein n=1 Tax=Magnetococcus sp. PR-3 TaxID=3120355 RepID=UPI002FCE1DDD
MKSEQATLIPETGFSEEQPHFLALAQNPHDATACLALGRLYTVHKIWSGALFFLMRAQQLQPQCAETADAIGRLYLEQHSWQAAIEAFGQAAALDPSHPVYLGNRAFCYRQLKRYAEAVADYRRVVQMDPAMGQTLGQVLLEQGADIFEQKLYDQAVELLQEAESLIPHQIEVPWRLARALVKCGHLPEAAKAYQRVLTLNPKLAEIHHALGTTLAQDKSLAQQATHHLRQALILSEGKSGALISLATHLMSNVEAELDDEAAQLYEQALKQWPDHAFVQYSLGCVRLLQGAYEEGWSLYESRFKATQTQTHHYMEQQPPDAPLWQGEPLKGKTLLIAGEQGFGDQLQMARLLAPLKKRCKCKLAVVTHPALSALFEQMPVVDKVWLLDHAPATGYDYWLPIMSLPHRLKVSLNKIPGQVPYLYPKTTTVKQWKKHLKGVRGKKVGLVWTGNPMFMKAMHKRVPLEELTSWGEIEGLTFISLQKDPMVGDEQTPLWHKMQHDEAHLHSFHDTAALIKNLDLVITIDTAVAHLAGGLGVPVWMMAYCKADFRWLKDRKDSPWYPTMQIFRGVRFANPWENVIEEVAQALREWVKLKP